MVTLYAVMVGDSVLDTFQQCNSGGSGLNYYYGTLYMLIFGIMFIIVLINVVRVQIEYSFFEAVPALVAEEHHDEDHEPDEFVEGWKNLGAEKEEKESQLNGFDFLGGAPSMRDITVNPKNPPIVFWSKSNSEKDRSHSEKRCSLSVPEMPNSPKVFKRAKSETWANNLTNSLPYIKEAGDKKTGRKNRVVVTKDEIIRFFMERIKEIRRSSGHYSSISLSGIDKELLKQRGIYTIEKIVAEYREKLRETLTISARILNVELSEIGLEEELSPSNSENDFAHFESLLSPRGLKSKSLKKIQEAEDKTAKTDNEDLSLVIMNPISTDITDL